MGMFSSKKTTVVSSTVYNLAGDEETRPHFIKNSIYASIMSDYNPYLGETLVNNHLNGPGMNQRSFFRWALRNNYAGLPTYSVSSSQSVDPAVLAPFITTPGSPAGLLLHMQVANLVSGEYDWVVEDYVLENFPDFYGTDYVTAYDKVTNDITIQWEGGGVEVFSAGTWTKDKTYVVAAYYHYLPSELQSLITGSTTVGVLTQPSTVGYTFDNLVNGSLINYPMNFDEQVITTYVGVGSPPDTDVSTADNDSVNFTSTDKTYIQSTYEGGDGAGESTVSREHFLHLLEYRNVYIDNTQVSVVVNEDTPTIGITQTIETRRVGQHLRPIWDWRDDHQDTINLKIEGGVHMFSYELFTGNTTLDDLLDEISVSASDAEYYPYMPIRLDNVSITHPTYDDITGSGLYEQTNRAYRRAAGGGHRFSKLVDEIEDNENIDDIDYAFTHHGVGMNVIEPACRKYMYTWFKNVSAFQNTSSTYMDEYKVLITTYVADKLTYALWVVAQGVPGDPLYGTARPDKPFLPDLKYTTVRLRCADSQLENLDMRITWINITETLHTGLAKAGAKNDEQWFEGYPVAIPANSETLIWTVFAGIMGATGGLNSKEFGIDKQTLYWQVDQNNYRKLTMWGLVHNNLVYNGEAVTITASEALSSTDPTGFIIPLHYQTVKDMGLVDATQMATANTFVVFNTYEIVKQKWYQGFIGMLIIIIVIIILAVVFAPAAGGGIGLLGSNAAVGAAMGLSGTAAIVAGAITNAIVAIIVSKIITYGSVALFGDKWGMIIATVINLAISLNAGGYGFDNISELGTAENLLKIGSAISNGYSGYVQGAVAEIGDEMQENQVKYEDKMDAIDKLLKELRGGTSGLNFNPLWLTDSVKGNVSSSDGVGYITESLDEFIHRTTMTGSEIVDLSLSMVNNYADLSLELPA